MKLVIFLINIVIIVLTEIGDFLLFYIFVLYKLVRKIIRLIKKLLIYIKNKLKTSIIKVKNYKKLESKKIKTYVGLLGFRRLIFVKNLRRSLRFRRKSKTASEKEYEKNLITFYPEPKHVRLKAKYFIFGSGI